MYTEKLFIISLILKPMTRSKEALDSEARAKRAALAIADIKLNGRKTFDLGELGDLLHQHKCPYAKSLPNILKKAQLIVPDTNGKGFFRFVNEDPVHFGLIQSELDKVSHATSKYGRRHRDKQKGITVALPKTELELAIEYLKSLGYKVLKPVTEFVEC